MIPTRTLRLLSRHIGMASGRLIAASLIVAAGVGAADAPAVASTATAAAPVAVGASAASETAPLSAPYIVMVDSRADTSTTTQRLERAHGFMASNAYRHAIRGFSAILTRSQVDRMRRDPAVTRLVPDIEISAAGRKAPKQVAGAEVTPVGVTRIGATDPGRTWGPAHTAVAVIDTGIDLGHPDLNAVHGVNCVKDGKSSQDDNGHGKHVAGTIAARKGGGGAVGVAPDTRLYSVKVLDRNSSGRLSGLLCGIDWVQGNAERLGIGVANVSITAAGGDDGACGTLAGDVLHAAICSSVQAGIVYVAAAGNDGGDFARTVPAAYPEVLTATAMTDTDGAAGASGGTACDGTERDDTYATYSNFATSPAAAAHTLAAPGTCVVSTGLGGGVVTMLGTSMAAPHVTAAAALCRGDGARPDPCMASAREDIVSVVIEQLRADAAARAADGFGFTGDPLEPLSGRHLGYLVSASDY